MHIHKAQGFNLVELIIVIVIAGIISAVAIPRFFDFSSDAYSAKLKATANSFATGVSLVHSSWLASGGTIDIRHITSEGGQIVGVGDFGWPENTSTSGGDGAFNATECVNLFSGLIKNAPSIAASPDVSKDFTASVGEDSITCIFTMNGTTGRSFTYDVSNGETFVTEP